MNQALNNVQQNIFDMLDCEKQNGYIVDTGALEKRIVFTRVQFLKFADYNLETYKQDVLTKGLKETWSEIIYFTLNFNVNNKFLDFENFAELYEIGLALKDKQAKKSSGQYYTPDDVAYVMADWFNRQKGVNVCDVACGTGKLILTYLDLLGKEKAIDLIKNGRLYLYDIDDVALSICKTILLIKYGKDLERYIHAVHCDFLSRNAVLPSNCKVISNPPYAKVRSLNLDWNKTEVALQTKELYSMFMEKIISQSESSVIVTPYSFVGGNKFYSLRKMMNNHNGFIVSFDNVPGNIFCGRKQGIFNTNTANSVRAAITVIENLDGRSGFRTTPLIRFKGEERSKLLKTDVLESFIGCDCQTVTKENPMFYKCSKELSAIWYSWRTLSSKRLGDYVSGDGRYILSMPSTCRYFTSASKGLMNRSGQVVLKTNDKNVFNYVFCLLNSSFAYWYWRLFDGGITYTRGLLLSMPVFYDILSEQDKSFFADMANEMIENAPNFKVTKNNVGVQENVKYPREYRDKINRRFLDILEINTDEKVFDSVHSNTALEINV